MSVADLVRYERMQRFGQKGWPAMTLLVIGLLLGIAYLVYVAIAGRFWQAQDESGEPRRPLIPLRRIR